MKSSREEITIRQVTTADLAELQKIGRQTFFETFAESNTEQNMQSYLAEGFSEKKLLAELNDPDSLFFFVVINDSIAGYLKVNTGASQAELKDAPSIEIERIYVLKHFHGKEAGQLLFEKAKEIAKAQKAAYIWLGVWEKNPRAIRFYEKNGFVEFDKHIFQLGDDRQTDILMKLKLD